MLRIFTFVLALIIAPQVASAQAIWVDYGLVMNPGSQATAVNAVEDYLEDNPKFNGLAIFNETVINGANPRTHNLAIIYNSQEEWERARQALLNTPRRAAFLETTFANGRVIDETAYMHVAGWGQTAREGTQYIAFAMQVSNPKRYIEMLDDYSREPGNATEISGIDLFQAIAGAPPGVTHVAVIAVGNRADFMKRYADPKFGKYLRKFAQVRQVLGVSYANNLSFSGPLSLESLR